MATAEGVRPGHEANCPFLTALYHVGLVGNPAAACRYRTISGCDLSSYKLKIASVGLDRLGRYLLGGCATMTVLVF